MNSSAAASPTRNIVLIALFAAIITVLSVTPGIPIAAIPVPITLQTLGIMLAGAVLGPVRGVLAVVTFLALVAAGLPLLAGGNGGIAAFAGPTAGYIIGWIPGAFVTGLIVKFVAIPQRAEWLRIVLAFLGAVVGCIAVVYAIGVPWLALSTGADLGATFSANLAFVPGDLIKAAVAAIVATRVHALFGSLIGTSRWRTRAEASTQVP